MAAGLLSISKPQSVIRPMISDGSMVSRCTYVHMRLPGVSASKLKDFHSFYGFEGLRGDYGPQKAVMALLWLCYRACLLSGQLVSASAIAGCAALEALKALEDLKGFKASCKQREY